MNLQTPVTIRATFDATKWETVCSHCGSAERHLSSEDPHGRHFTDGRMYCERCDSTATPDLAPEPVERRGFCDPQNPWGTVSYADSEPTELELPFSEALELLSEFPGGIWNHSESYAEQNVRTGEYVSVCAHVSGPTADLVLSALAAL